MSALLKLARVAEVAFYALLCAWMFAAVARFQATVGTVDTRTAWIHAVEGPAVAFFGIFQHR